MKKSEEKKNMRAAKKIIREENEREKQTGRRRGREREKGNEKDENRG